VNKKYKVALSGAILAITVWVFVSYIIKNPEIIQQISLVSPLMIVAICVLYLGVIVALGMVNSISVALCGKKITNKSSLSLTGSSSIANFFGPLQGGVGIRAVYFKKKLGIPLKHYGIVSLYYYAMYAFISGAMLLVGSAALRLPLFACLIVGSAGTAWYIKNKLKNKSTLSSYASPALIGKLFAATFLQLSLLTVIYFVEFLAIGKTVSLEQIISYTGAANFSLFVAITPGAIGVREAFVVFSQSLHQIGYEAVIAANILDRAVYVLFLALLFIWLISTHTRVKLNERKTTKKTDNLV
jgi:uncharacterized membrane protein YbhN (UPF0104 family)